MAHSAGVYLGGHNPHILSHLRGSFKTCGTKAIADPHPDPQPVKHLLATRIQDRFCVVNCKVRAATMAKAGQASL